MKRFENLQIAASIDEQSCQTMTPNLFRLLGNRQIVARDLLRSAEDGSEEFRIKNELYNRIEYDIKRLLGLE